MPLQPAPAPLLQAHFGLPAAEVRLAHALACGDTLPIATSIAIGTATIAAFIGAGGYGERIVTGLALNDDQLLLAGALPATMLALLSEVLFEVVERMIRQRRA